MRKQLVAGNWKMHGSKEEVHRLIEGIKDGMMVCSSIDVVVLPAFVHLTEVQRLLSHTPIALGAQNLYLGAQGAFTGEVSGPMLKDVGCEYVLIGHSERRTVFHEDLNLVAAKFKAALQAGLKPILCVGETREQRERGQTEAVVREQLESVMQFVGISEFQPGAIAYEPVWAIGTGLTATPEQAQAVHAFIRNLIRQNNVDLAETIRILYGGSVKADNADSLFAQLDIDGGLIGGASLVADSFLAICAEGSL